MNINFTVFDALQQCLQAVDIHRIGHAVTDGLVDQRVVRNFPFATDVFKAGQLVGKNDRDQVLGVVPLPLGRLVLTVAHTLHGQGDGCIPAPAHFEHRCIQQRLHQDLPDGGGFQVGGNVFCFEAVGFAE